jgi:excisionase family DNA binding protein
MDVKEIPDFVEVARRKGLLYPEDAADWLSISRARLYQLLTAGEIESVKIGRSRRIPVQALERFVERLQSS